MKIKLTANKFVSENDGWLGIGAYAMINNMFDRMQKLEAVAEAAQKFRRKNNLHKLSTEDVFKAIAALELALEALDMEKAE